MEKLTIFGLPLNPLRALDELAGASFCVSYATRKKLGPQLADAIRLVGEHGMLLVDNGAYSLHRRGVATRDESYLDGFEAWANNILRLCPQAVAVIPDVIDGTEAENAELVRTTLLDRDRAMGVWHLDESLEYLIWLCESLNFVAFGSAGRYSNYNSPAWHARVAEAFAAIDKWEAEGEGANLRPRLHMFKVQSKAHLFPFDSSDSCNVARNHGRYRGTPGRVGKFAARIDAKIQASAGEPADHQIKRPILDGFDASLARLVEWFDANYTLERRQMELPLAA
jgi:hypothetical protein